MPLGFHTALEKGGRATRVERHLSIVVTRFREILGKTILSNQQQYMGSWKSDVASGFGQVNVLLDSCFTDIAQLDE